ncbi:M4 family metallopeptidase [Legionella sp. W05-934-2]|jgi:pseudolysin|uniref:M4 family metallopeptidase n=1 Tax=Legionella sp. W05-934-2 TaxID=1198649 RepID=UPI003461EC55
MHYTLKLSPLALAIGIGFSTASVAATQIDLHKASFNQIRTQFSIADTQQLKMDKNAIQFLKKHIDKNKITHARYQQYYHGVKVFGGHAIFHGKAMDKLSLTGAQPAKMNGRLYANLANELGEPNQSFHSNANVALKTFLKAYAGESLSEESVTPMVYIDDKNKAHWAYEVSVLISYPDKIPARPTAIIDANTFKPFVQWNNLKTIHEPVKGLGFGGNVKVGKTEFGKELPALDITRDAESQTCFMETPDIKVVDMEGRTSHSLDAATFPCTIEQQLSQNYFWTGVNNDGYDEINGAYSPINDAMYAGMVIKYMYKDWYNLEVLTNYDGSPMQLVMRVHYSRNYENAFWDGKKMTFGDGGSWLYPLVSLGVGAHEISHGFTEQHSDLYYFGQSGGMNESFSDMAAMAAEHYSVGKETWMIGSEIVKDAFGEEALRYMDNPSRDGTSINTADDYYGGLDVHYSSGVFNRLFYLIATKPGWDAQKAFDVMVKANMDYWTPYSNFDEGGCGIYWSAQDLGYNQDDVIDALNQVTIKVENCSKNG